MQKNHIFSAVFVGFMIIILCVSYLYVKHQTLLEQRHHLLCEVLKPGMSPDEVLSILK